MFKEPLLKFSICFCFHFQNEKPTGEKVKILSVENMKPNDLNCILFLSNNLYFLYILGFSNYEF